MPVRLTLRNAVQLLRVLLSLGLMLQVLGPAAVITSYASTVSTAVFSGGAGTATVGGVLYAKQGQALTLTVTTSADTKCVQVTGAHTAKQTSVAAKSSWTFPFTAGTGDGVQSVTAAASPNFNANNCTGQSQNPQSASYILDNTGPTLLPSDTNKTGVSPTPNAAGWNNSNVSVAWTASDGSGSGVGSGPTPVSASVTANNDSVVLTSSATDRVGNVGNGSVAVKLDKAGPTITGSASPAPNAAGWNNSDVTVNFTCKDPPPSDNANAKGSGIKSCTGPQTLTSSGAGQSVSGTAVDNADNTKATSVGPINIDKIPPTLSGAPTTQPNTAGWYNANVTIAWSCSDALSGIPLGGCPANSSISTEGTGQTATASVSDKAGNPTTATSSPAVKIDKTAPVTTATAPDPSAWNNKAVTVNLHAADNLSLVAGTFYTLDAAAQQPYNPATGISISGDGMHILTFWSVDNAGNEEFATGTTHKSIQVKIDQTPPTINHTQSPLANAAGWNNTNVTVTFVCADTVSGIASCTAPQTVTTEGKDQQVTGTATDNAANTANDPATVSIDKTAPTIAADRSLAANANGWNNTDVTVSFSCNDTLSGIASCPPAQTLVEGANQTSSGTATDAAGNSASASVSGINIDKTPPSLSGAPTTPANANGWYRADVSIAWSCSDALSGIAAPGTCPPNSTIDGEGSGLKASASVSDTAGNTTSASSSPAVNIDRTAPSTSASVPDPLASGWYAGPVTVTLPAVDSLSGVASTSYSVDGGAAQAYAGPFSHGVPGVHTVTFWSQDKADNVEDQTAPGHTITLKIDNIAPTITGSRSPDANGFGWNNTDVVVSFNCSDAESGIAACPDGLTLSAEGAGQSASGTATDNAGNSASTTVSNINIDKTMPALLGAATTPTNAAGWYKGDVIIHWTGQDGLAGIDPATQPADSLIAGEGLNLGAGPVTIADKAGNISAPASVSGINIDRTPPSISGKTVNEDGTARSANAAGWFNTAVRVRFTCADVLSGIPLGGCPGDAVLDKDGTAQSASGTATDAAGNTASAAASGINIDSTRPQTEINNRCDSTTGFCKNNTVTLVVTARDLPPTGTTATPSKAKQIRYNWSFDGGTTYKNATDIAGPVTDGTPVQVTLSTSASGTALVKFYAVDNADNQEQPNYASIKFDNIAPGITHVTAPTLNAAGWTNANVDVKFTAVDDDLGSGVDGNTVKCGAPDAAGTPAGGTVTTTDNKTFVCDALWGTETMTQAINAQADDVATNRGKDAETVKLDKTAPTITGAATTSPNPNGWYNGPVTAKFTCADQGPVQSGIQTCTGVTGTGAAAVNNGVTLSTNGANQSVKGTAMDKADNTATTTVSPINIDTEKPAITINGIANGGVYTVGAVPAASCTATDGFSSIDANGCKLTVTGGTANGVGTFAFTATATDKASNTTTVTGSYKVQYRFDGFLQPINDTAHQQICGTNCSYSIFKAGSTVPVKFQLKDAAGNIIQTNATPVWANPQKGNLTTMSVDESAFTDPADTANTYRWDPTSQQYIFNWGTSKTGAGYFWQIGVKLDDGTFYVVDIGLR